MKHNILFVGLDTHKESPKWRIAGSRSEFSTWAGSSLPKRQSPRWPVSVKANFLMQHFTCYEGPRGYWIYRLLTSLAHCCYIVAPSLIPKKPGNVSKPINAMPWISLARLDPIYVPEPRTKLCVICLSRERAMQDLNDAANSNHFCSETTSTTPGRRTGQLKHLRWLTEIILPHPSQQFVLQEMIRP